MFCSQFKLENFINKLTEMLFSLAKYSKLKDVEDYSIVQSHNMIYYKLIKKLLYWAGFMWMFKFTSYCCVQYVAKTG